MKRDLLVNRRFDSSKIVFVSHKKTKEEIEKSGRRAVMSCCSSTAKYFNEFLDIGMDQIDFEIIEEVFKGHNLANFDNYEYDSEKSVSIQVIEKIVLCHNRLSTNELKKCFIENIELDIYEKSKSRHKFDFGEFRLEWRKRKEDLLKFIFPPTWSNSLSDIISSDAIEEVKKYETQLLEREFINIDGKWIRTKVDCIKYVIAVYRKSFFLRSKISGANPLKIPIKFYSNRFRTELKDYVKPSKWKKLESDKQTFYWI